MFNAQSVPSQQQPALSNVPIPAPTSQSIPSQPTSATPDQQAQLRELLDLLVSKTSMMVFQDHSLIT